MKRATATTGHWPSLNKLHTRSDLHLARKLWHMSMGLLVVFVYLVTEMSRGTAVAILGTCLAISVIIDFLRLKYPSFNRRAINLWRPIMRKGEEKRFTGVPYYIASAMLAIGVFPEPIAIMSLLFLACGDPAASFFGILYGKYGPRFKSGKSMIGTLAAIVVCTIVSLVYLSVLPIASEDYILLALIGGVAGGSVELLPLEIDDNFSIPILSGLILWVAFTALGV